MDRRVLFTLIIISLLSLGLLSYKIASNVHCVPFKIMVRGYSAGTTNSFYLGQTLHFKTNFKGKGKIEWDFGDKKQAVGDSVSHTYDREGGFIVTATISGKCIETQKIFIVQLEQQKSTNAVSMTNPISGPELVYAGEPANFSCALAANSYEWTVLNAPEFPVQNQVNATYTFPIAGTRIIELKLDGDNNKVFRKNIQVLPQATSNEPAKTTSDMAELPPLPPPSINKEDNKEDNATPAKPKIMVIANEEFKAMLDNATEGKTDLQTLSQYLCNGAQTKALLNGTEWETVGSFMAKIYNKKRYDIKSVEAVRDENNCVTVLKIKYKKRLF
jgi:PKD repeat protein